MEGLRSKLVGTLRTSSKQHSQSLYITQLASHFIGAEDEERYLLMLTFRVTAPKLDSLVTIRTLKS